jgi:hypothetical protein
VYVFAIKDSTAWAAWDHVTGDGPPGVSSPGWSFRYPAGISGTHIGEQFQISAVSAQLLPAPPGLGTGRPFHLVMQIFPDGRCGLALDGKRVWVGPANFFEPAVHVMLAGNSVGTKMLIGHVRIVTGIAPNIAWDSRVVR